MKKSYITLAVLFLASCALVIRGQEEAADTGTGEAGNATNETGPATPGGEGNETGGIVPFQDHN